MSQPGQEIDKLDPQEAALVRAFRMIAPQEREEIFEITKVYVEFFPVRPALHLVKSSG